MTSVQNVKEALAKGKDEDSLLVRVKRGKGSLYVAMAK